MELSQLRYFVAVAQLQHLTKAAEALNISQPALSKAISRLEDELGETLFDRGANRITLNNSGKLYLSYVQQALETLDSGKAALQSQADSLSGSVSIITSCSGLLQPAVRHFITEYSQIHYQQHRYASSLIAEQLEGGSADFAVATTPLTSVKFSWTPLLQDQLYVVASPKHPFYGRTSITMEELQHEPLIVSNQLLTIHDIVIEGFAKFGMSPNVAYELNNPPLTEQLLRENRGLCFVPGLKVDPMPIDEIEPRQLIAVEGQPFQYEVGILKLRGRYQRPVAGFFAQFLQDWFSLPQNREMTRTINNVL